MTTIIAFLLAEAYYYLGMVYKQLSEILTEHTLPIQSLAEAKNIKLTIEHGIYPFPQLTQYYKYLTEFVLLIGRIINQSVPQSEIVISLHNLKNGNEDMWCSIFCNNLKNQQPEFLNLGLELTIRSTQLDRGIQIDVFFPKNLSFNAGLKHANNHKSSTQLNPFHYNLRKNLKSHITTIKSLYQEATNMSMEDGKFLEKVNQVIDENLDTAHFGAINLSRSMGISRSQLCRKLKPLVRRSPATYIRYSRLTKAKELLERTNSAIGDIAFEVGYSDQSHFTRAFKNQFGYHPSFYRNETKKIAEKSKSKSK